MSIRQLFQLQTLEQDIAAREQALSRALGQVGESPALKEAKVNLAAARNALEADSKEQRAAEGTIADLTARMTAIAESLYSGRTRNPKELQILQHELEILKTQRDPLEEQDLALMEKIEADKVRVDGFAEALATAEATWQMEQISLQEEIAAIEKSLAESKARREQFLPEVPAGDLALYNQTKRSRGQAIALVAQGTCGKCRLTLSTSETQRVRGGQTVVCSSCGRLLFFDQS